MNIHEIKNRTLETSPYFFDRKSMRFFGQTMRSFSIKKQSDGRYLISAPMFDRTTGRTMGTTKRFFNPITIELDHN